VDVRRTLDGRGHRDATAITPPSRALVSFHNCLFKRGVRAVAESRRMRPIKAYRGSSRSPNGGAVWFNAPSRYSGTIDDLIPSPSQPDVARLDLSWKSRGNRKSCKVAILERDDRRRAGGRSGEAGPPVMADGKRVVTSIFILKGENVAVMPVYATDRGESRVREWQS